MLRREFIMANNNPAHTVLTNVRLSYVNLLQPRSLDDGTLKYSATLLIPKNPTDNRAKIDTAIRAATEKARSKHGAQFPATPKISIHDGDGVRPSDGQPYGPECKGCWIVTASNRDRVPVVRPDLQPIMNSTEIYSCMWANVGITLFSYNLPTNKGIGVALDTVMKIRDDEPLGGTRASVEDDFAGLVQPDAAPAFAPPAPQAAPAMGAPQYTVPPYAPAGVPYAPPNAVPAVDPITGQPIMDPPW